MVVSHHLKDIFDVSSKVSDLTLPAFKEHGLKIKFEKDDVFETVFGGKEPPIPFSNSDVFYANIIRWRRLTPVNENCKAVYEVTFDVKDSNFQFKAGDTIGIIPHNNNTEVEAIINHLNIMPQADIVYHLTADTCLKGAKIPLHIPVKSTLRHVLTNCVDVRSIVKKLFILSLSRYTKDENERKALEFLCSKEGSATYNTYILNKHLCIVDIFEIFKTCRPPIDVILANLPRLLPRPYSIVNSGLKNNKVIKICFSVMDMGNNKKGLASGWLEDLIVNKEFDIEHGMKNMSINHDNSMGRSDYKVPIYLRKNLNRFLLPDLSTPILLIGPGTGVAPFIGFLEEREYLRDKYMEIEMGNTWLFFGSRNPDNFIYRKELEYFVSEGVLNKLSTAFSRIENGGIKYVQDALIQNGKEIAKLIEGGASIFVCGDLKAMSTQVREIIVKCLTMYGNKSQEEADICIVGMEKEKRYLTDIWS